MVLLAGVREPFKGGIRGFNGCYVFFFFCVGVLNINFGSRINCVALPKFRGNLSPGTVRVLSRPLLPLLLEVRGQT